MQLRHHFRNAGNRLKEPIAARFGSAAYWNVHNVANLDFQDLVQSRDYFDWRNSQYPGYIDLMPVDKASGLTVLDYGCGPGNDLVGFAWKSEPNRLIGVDVSSRSLEISANRMALEGREVELYKVEDDASFNIPLPDNSVDLIHSSGVLHHCSNLARTMSELRRVLKVNGRMQVMLYNYDSVWLHLYVAYSMGVKERKYRNEDILEIFRKSTDGKNCPISVPYKASEFINLSEQLGFSTRHIGNAISVHEMMELPLRFEAIRDNKLESKHREFLLNLTFTSAGFPLNDGQIAGINACYILTKASS
jgi:ubiquinone/menaquinone biosynthesis C-methylase UbiE